VRFEFNEAKNQLNRQKHGITLSEAQKLWAAIGVEFDLGIVNGEYRYMRVGPMLGDVYLAVFTFRGGSIRLISARKATAAEKVKYEQARR